MNIRKHLDAFMAKLGCVRVPAKLAPSTINMKLNFEIDSTPLDSAIAKLDQLSAAASRAEAAINDALLAQEGEFINSESVSNPFNDKLGCEIRALTEEMRRARREYAATHGAGAAPATGTAASGLPG